MIRAILLANATAATLNGRLASSAFSQGRAAARDGCTNIPLAAGRGSGDETILSIGMSGHGYHRFVHPDPPELIRSWEI